MGEIILAKSAATKCRGFKCVQESTHYFKCENSKGGVIGYTCYCIDHVASGQESARIGSRNLVGLTRKEFLQGI
jgi:hypothetical protein